jgi:hypothetical protein
LWMISAQALCGCCEGKPVPTPHQVRGRLFRIMLTPARHPACDTSR